MWIVEVEGEGFVSTVIYKDAKISFIVYSEDENMALRLTKKESVLKLIKCLSGKCIRVKKVEE